MNVSNIGSTQPVATPSTSGVDKRAALQMMLLRKSLDAQKDQAAELSRQIEGKGQVLDVKV